MSYSSSYSITEAQRRSNGSLLTFFKEFPFDDGNQDFRLPKYPNVVLRPSAFPFKFKQDSSRDETSPSENCTLVRNSIATLRPPKPFKKASKSNGYRESFRKRLSNAEMVYRRSFLINDEDTKKWHIYDPCFTEILKERPPDVPLRSSSLFQGEETRSRRPSYVYIPINGLLLAPRKSFERKVKQASKKKRRSPAEIITKTFKVLRKYIKVDRIFGKKAARHRNLDDNQMEILV